MEVERIVRHVEISLDVLVKKKKKRKTMLKNFMFCRLFVVR
jgi:hypothetical protein